MPTTRRAALIAASSLSFLAYASSTSAQALGASADQTDNLSEVVVTAQSREQRAINVPIALTTYSSARLEADGVREFDDLALLTPGFEVNRQSPNNSGFVMRGVTSTSLEAGSEPRVSVFQDGVSISKSEGSYVELFDIERVEIAKGPQSTLFGRGALIGALQIVQAKASVDAPQIKAAAEVGDYNARMAEIMINAPLSDTFAVRLAARSKRRDGYVENALGGPDFQSIHTDAARLSLAWRAGQGASADLILNYQRDQPTGTAFKSGVLRPADPVTGRVLAGLDPSAPAAQAAPTDFENGPNLGLDRVVWGTTLLAKVPVMDGLVLSSTSAFRHFQSTEANDPDGTGLPILTAINAGIGDQWSQELRLNFDRGGALSWFAGASFFKYEGHHRTPIQFDERLMLATLSRQLNASALQSGLPADTAAPLAVLTNPAFSAALLQGLVAGLSDNVTTPGADPRIVLSSAQALALAGNLRGNQKETSVDTSRLESWDVFGDVTARLTDRLEISGGVRYTRDDKTTGFAAFLPEGRSVLSGAIGAARLAGGGSSAGLAQALGILGALQSPAAHTLPGSVLPLFGFSFQPTANNGDLVTADNKDEGLTWRITARYDLADTLKAYAVYARGRRPEVLAASAPAAPLGAPRFTRVAAEKVDSFEVGLKGRVEPARLNFDLAAYTYRYTNFETLQQDGTRLIPSNAGEASAYGVEAQGQWAATGDLDLFATYAFNHGRFTTGAFDGNHFRQAPDHSLSVGASWRFEAPGGIVDVRPSATWQSKMFFDDNNDRTALQQPPTTLVPDLRQDEVQKAYGLLNLRVGYRPTNSPMAFEVFATNLTNERYLIDAGNVGDVIGLPTFVAGAPRFIGARLAITLN